MITVAELRSLGQLLASPEGIGFLEEHGAFIEADVFVDQLRPPTDGRLNDLLGIGAGGRPVSFGHQISCDYQASVVCKFDAAKALAALPGVAPAFLAVDTDRSGGNRTTTTVTWGDGPGAFAVRLVTNKVRQMETRFVVVEPDRLDELIERLGEWLAKAEEATRPEVWQPRLAVLATALAGTSTLAEVNLALTRALLDQHLDYQPPCLLLSHLSADGFLQPALSQAVERIDDFVRVYNEAIDDLVDAGIDPQVRPLDDDYLPLHFACPKDDRRERLRHVRRGGDHFAAATCYCGEEYEFHLDTPALHIDEVVATGRWSTDVTFLVYVNDLTSGMIPGRSSALYGLVLGQVNRRVLGGTPVPMYLPSELASTASTGRPDSLVYDYLTAP